MSVSTAAWAWIPIVLWAALAQTVRNAAQRSLTATAGTLAATLVRFLYGLPLAIVWLAVVKYGGSTLLAGALPENFTPAYFAWLAVAAVTQLAATALMLAAMAERNFIIAITWTKTDVLQVAVFSSLFLHEWPSVLALFAIVVATLGVVLLSRPAGSQAMGFGGRPALLGIGAGGLFALASVGYRGASLQMPGVSPWLVGAWGVVGAQLLQTVLMGGWLAWRDTSSLGVIFRAWKLSTVAGCMGALASIAWLTATALRPAADVRTLGLVEVIFSYLVSHRVFGERLSRREKIGMAMVTIGLVAVCLQL
jgi:drug/metabolite transporter (DMT)-like permease